MANSYTEGQRKNVIVLVFIYDFGEESSWFLCFTLKDNSGLWLATGELKGCGERRESSSRSGRNFTSRLGLGYHPLSPVILTSVFGYWEVSPILLLPFGSILSVRKPNLDKPTNTLLYQVDNGKLILSPTRQFSNYKMSTSLIEFVHAFCHQLPFVVFVKHLQNLG